MILHITTRKQWEDANLIGTYSDSSSEDEGFIHCSTQAQILRTANSYYHGRSGLLLLCISSSRVKAPIVFEDSYQKGESYPHIYGPLNLDAVVGVFDFPADRNGLFNLPDDMQTLFEANE